MASKQSKAKSRKITDFMVPRSEASKEPVGQSSGSLENIMPQGGNAGLEELRELFLKRMIQYSEKKKEDSTGEGEASKTELGKENGRIMGVIEQIASSKLVKTIECDQQGLCSDGRSIGEIFVDEYGVKRQRGFINTTRLPIFLDFIAEEAEARPVLRKAYEVKTSRGSLALVPEDFLCELSSRYGVLVSNIDKCLNYRSTPWRERSKAPRKKQD